MKDDILNLTNQILEGQKEKLLKCGRSFVPTLTPEDVLQPADYRELEHNPHFRYEEGILEGIHTLRTALLAYFAEQEGHGQF
jgi:hypothetical protein